MNTLGKAIHFYFITFMEDYNILFLSCKNTIKHWIGGDLH